MVWSLGWLGCWRFWGGVWYSLVKCPGLKKPSQEGLGSGLTVTIFTITVYHHYCSHLRQQRYLMHVDKVTCVRPLVRELGSAGPQELQFANTQIATSYLCFPTLQLGLFVITIQHKLVSVYLFASSCLGVRGRSRFRVSAGNAAIRYFLLMSLYSKVTWPVNGRRKKALDDLTSLCSEREMKSSWGGDIGVVCELMSCFLKFPHALLICRLINCTCTCIKVHRFPAFQWFRECWSFW